MLITMLNAKEDQGQAPNTEYCLGRGTTTAVEGGGTTIGILGTSTETFKKKQKCRNTISHLRKHWMNVERIILGWSNFVNIFANALCIIFIATVFHLRGYVLKILIFMAITCNA